MAKAHANSWEVTDEFWSRVEPLVPQPARDPDKQYKRAAGAGRPSKPPRLVFEAIMYVLRTGCQWKALPAERFGSASAIHQKFMLWSKAGFFENLWRAGLAEYDDFEGIAWRWQSIDGAMFKAPLAQEAVAPNPTGSGKKGSKRHLLVDGRGVPLSLVVTGANAHDVTQLEAVLASCMIKRPTPKQRRSKHLCADAGYRGKNAMKIILAHGYIPHVVGRKARQSARNAIRRRRRAAGWWRHAMGGSTDSASCWCATKSWSTRFSRLTIWPLPSSPCERFSLPVNIIYG